MPTSGPACTATLDLKLIRLDAELAGVPLTEPDTLAARVDPILIAAESGLMGARASVLKSQLDALRHARLQKEREYQSAVATSAGLQNQLALLAIERAQVLPLVDLGVLGITEQFRLDSALNDIETQVEVLAQLGELTTRLPALQQRLTQTELRSPVNGVVNQVYVNSVGAVVAAGDPVIEIVPNDGALQVEVDIAPADIATIEPGQPAQIALTAFDATRYGYIDGTLLRVSADATFNDQQQQRMFAVEVSIDTVLADSNNVDITVLPGMIAQVSIIRGDRTILEYFWQPIARTKERALRE